MRTKKKQKHNNQKIEKQLTALERRLMRELQEKLSNLQNTSRTDPSELLDIAVEGEIDYMSAVSAEAGAATIDEIHQALQKLREGTYGICEACGKSIKKRRLRARPFAVLCISCKEKEERRGRARAAGPALARLDGGVSVNLTGEDVEDSEGSIEELFRDAEDVEINEIY